MVNVSKYKITALILASIFAVFNIGVPIVLYACPMMNQTPYTSSCCVDQQSQQGVNLRASMDRSCCKTVYAAERNTTQFVQGKDISNILHYSTAPILQCNIFLVLQLVIITHKLNSPSPPLADDIPVFNSSLLI